MSLMSELHIAIQEDLEFGILSFRDIAKKHNVPLNWVNIAWVELCHQEHEESLRDHAEGLADY